MLVKMWSVSFSIVQYMVNCVLSDLGYEKYNMMRQDPALVFLGKCGPPDGAALAAEQNDDDEYVLKKRGKDKLGKTKFYADDNEQALC